MRGASASCWSGACSLLAQRATEPSCGIRTPFIDELKAQRELARRDPQRLLEILKTAIQAGNVHEIMPTAGQSAGGIHEVLPVAGDDPKRFRRQKRP